MKDKYQPDQQVYFLICGHYVTQATVVATSSCFVTIRFNKNHAAESIIRLPHNRIFATKEEASAHIYHNLPPKQLVIQEESGEYVCTRRWDLWE